MDHILCSFEISVIKISLKQERLFKEIPIDMYTSFGEIRNAFNVLIAHSHFFNLNLIFIKNVNQVA